MEIRPITEHEVEQFFQLLCEVFNLSAERARPIFFREPSYDLRRKWALFLPGGEMAAILTTTPLHFAWGKAIGIAGVATALQHRRKGLGQQLLESVLCSSEAAGERGAVLFAHQKEVYEKVGFQHTDSVIRALVMQDSETEVLTEISMPEIKQIYADHVRRHPGWLIRDEQRWNLWEWILKPCERWNDGYLCIEHATVREAVAVPAGQPWPLSLPVQWVGLESVTQELGVPTVGKPQTEMMVMTRGFPEPLRMFLTDQF